MDGGENKGQRVSNDARIDVHTHIYSGDSEVGFVSVATPQSTARRPNSLRTGLLTVGQTVCALGLINHTGHYGAPSTWRLLIPRPHNEGMSEYMRIMGQDQCAPVTPLRQSMPLS